MATMIISIVTNPNMYKVTNFKSLDRFHSNQTNYDGNNFEFKENTIKLT